MAEHIELDRSFWPVEADKEHDPEAIRIMAALGVGRQVSWDELLKNPRIVILGEPGTGKTVKRCLGSKLNYTLYKRQIKLVNSDLTIGFQKKKAKS